MDTRRLLLIMFGLVLIGISVAFVMYDVCRTIG